LKQQVINTGLYECYDDYFIAYKSIRSNRCNRYNFQYQYLTGETYEVHCDCTDDEKAAIAKVEQLKQQEEERKWIELEKRKNTPGYCHLCGAEHAEYIPFEEMYLCENCYYDLKY
jgi:hypothetical protein